MTEKEMYNKWKIADLSVSFLEKNHFDLFKQKFPIPTGIPLVVEEDGLLTVKCIDIMEEAEYRWVVLREAYEKALKRLVKRANKTFDRVIKYNIDEKDADKELFDIYYSMIVLYLAGPHLKCTEEELKYLFRKWQKVNNVVDIFRFPINWMHRRNISLPDGRIITNLYDDELGQVALMKLYSNGKYNYVDYLADKGKLGK